MSREIRITPSILNADFSRLNEEINRIAGVSDLLHLDVMDDVFVPNFTFDFEAASKIIKDSSLPVDAHLMVANVDQIAVQYAEIGCASVTIHAEATENIPATLRIFVQQVLVLAWESNPIQASRITVIALIL